MVGLVPPCFREAVLPPRPGVSSTRDVNNKKQCNRSAVSQQ
jgi:hypothetical protein